MLKSKQKQPERIDAYPIGININQVHDFVKNIREFGSQDGSLGAADISAEDLGIREAVQLHFHNLRIRVLSLFEDWSHRKKRAEKKLEEIVQLIKTNELLASMLISLHNVYFYQQFMHEIRKSIKSRTFTKFYNKYIKLFN